MVQNTHLLLTGGQGRVAKSLRTALSARDWSVTAYSRSTAEDLLPLNDLLEGDEPLGAKALIHCAWSTVPSVAQDHPEYTALHDLPLMEKLIARLKADPNPPLFVFMSTGALYGPAVNGPSSESNKPNPLGNYAKGKLEAEQMLVASGLKHTILRVSNLYGMASSATDQQGVIAKLARMAIEGKTFEQWGDHSIKDYLHVSDFAKALQLIITTPLTGVVNVARGEPTNLNDLISLVNKAVGTELKVAHRPGVPWDVTNNQLDISRLQSATGWAPEVTIEQGVCDEVARLRASLTP